MNYAHVTPQQAAAWRELRGKGIGIREISRRYKVTASTVRYHTDDKYREKLHACNERYARVKKEAIASGFIFVPKAQQDKPVVETFGEMPAWPKPGWLTSFDERMK